MKNTTLADVRALLADGLTANSSSEIALHLRTLSDAIPSYRWFFLLLTLTTSPFRDEAAAWDADLVEPVLTHMQDAALRGLDAVEGNRDADLADAANDLSDAFLLLPPAL